MLVRAFSKHFVQNWVAWRGDFPCIEEVNGLIDSGQQLRPQISLFKRMPDGSFADYTLLSEFWNHEAGVVLRIDASNGMAVTIICAGRRKKFKEYMLCKDRNPQMPIDNYAQSQGAHVGFPVDFEMSTDRGKSGKKHSKKH